MLGALQHTATPNRPGHAPCTHTRAHCPRARSHRPRRAKNNEWQGAAQTTATAPRRTRGGAMGMQQARPAAAKQCHTAAMTWCAPWTGAQRCVHKRSRRCAFMHARVRARSKRGLADPLGRAPTCVAPTRCARQGTQSMQPQAARAHNTHRDRESEREKTTTIGKTQSSTQAARPHT